jgi:hypothetical protein
MTAIGEAALIESTKFESVTLPDSWTEIRRYTFASCYYLTSIALPTCFHDRTSLKSVLLCGCLLCLQYMGQPVFAKSDSEMHLPPSNTHIPWQLMKPCRTAHPSRPSLWEVLRKLGLLPLCVSHPSNLYNRMALPRSVPSMPMLLSVKNCPSLGVLVSRMFQSDRNSNTTTSHNHQESDLYGMLHLSGVDYRFRVCALDW